MRGAHATLFFDLVLSTMLVIVVLLSMQKLHADSRSQDETWPTPMFVPVSLFVATGPVCMGGVQGSKGERVMPFAVFQLPLEPSATSHISCESATPILFFVPDSSRVAKYWLCPTRPNGPVTFRVIRDATTDSVSYECDAGANGTMAYPLRMDEIAKMIQPPSVSATGR